MGSQVLACKAACFLPPGSGWISDPPPMTTVFGFFFFPPSFLLQQLRDWLAHGASRQHLIRNEEASLSSDASCCSDPPTVTPLAGFLPFSSWFSRSHLPLPPPQSDLGHRVLGLNYLDGGLGRGGAWSLQSCLAVSCTKRTDRIVLHAAAANTANNSLEQYPSALPVKSPLPCPPSTVLSDFPPTGCRFAVTLLGHPPSLNDPPSFACSR